MRDIINILLSLDIVVFDFYMFKWILLWEWEILCKKVFIIGVWMYFIRNIYV